jgi:hypothetical protein
MEEIRKKHNIPIENHLSSPVKYKEPNDKTKINSDSKSKTLGGLKTTVDISNRNISAESSFVKQIFKEFSKYMQVTAKSIFERYTNVYLFLSQDKSICCRKDEEVFDPVVFKTDLQHFQILKAAFRQEKKHAKEGMINFENSLVSDFKNEKEFKTTNFKSPNFTSHEIVLVL